MDADVIVSFVKVAIKCYEMYCFVMPLVNYTAACTNGVKNTYNAMSFGCSMPRAEASQENEEFEIIDL